MFKQTNYLDFEKYGTTLSSLPEKVILKNNKQTIYPSDKSIEKLFVSDCDFYIRLRKGVVLILVSKDSSFKNIESYILNGKVKINKNIFYNFIPISEECCIDLFSDNPLSSYVCLSQPYTYKEITPNISIDKIYTKFYQEKAPNYLFKGEKHDFWELTYIDRGTLYTQVDGVEYKLDQGSLLFYAPGQYHNQYTDDKKSCSYLTVSFDMDFKLYELLSNKVFLCNKELHSIINNLITELHATHLYCDELALCYLKQLILKLLSIDLEKNIIKPVNKVQQFFDDKLLNTILIFIGNNIYEYITIQQICDEFNISNAKLHLLFKTNLDTTPKVYINDLKLKKSKELITEANYTVSEISEMLGYNSIHYFSNKFKKTYGFSPSEYRKSINRN